MGGDEQSQALKMHVTDLCCVQTFQIKDRVQFAICGLFKKFKVYHFSKPKLGPRAKCKNCCCWQLVCHIFPWWQIETLQQFAPQQTPAPASYWAMETPLVIIDILRTALNFKKQRLLCVLEVALDMYLMCQSSTILWKLEIKQKHNISKQGSPLVEKVEVLVSYSQNLQKETVEFQYRKSPANPPGLIIEDVMLEKTAMIIASMMTDEHRLNSNLLPS